MGGPYMEVQHGGSTYGVEGAACAGRATIYGGGGGGGGGAEMGRQPEVGR